MFITVVTLGCYGDLLRCNYILMLLVLCSINLVIKKVHVEAVCVYKASSELDPSYSRTKIDCVYLTVLN